MSHNIDKIVYINLAKRTDRLAEIQAEMANFNLEAERFEAIECLDYGTYGCGMSHLTVLKMAKERNYKNILIFEDDFTFCVSKDEFEKNLESFFNQYPNFDVCMLSYNMLEFEEIQNSVVNKVLSAQTASGYIINQHYYDYLIQLYEWAMPLLIQTRESHNYTSDQVWKPLQRQHNWYFFKTRIGKQRPSYSDNGYGFADYGC